MGLFAIRSLKAGELITCFLGNALLVWSKVAGDKSGDISVLLGPHIMSADSVDVKTQAGHVTSDTGRNYELKIGNGESLVNERMVQPI